MDVTIPDALAQICADTLSEVERRRAETPATTLVSRLHLRRNPTRGFGHACRCCARTLSWTRGKSMKAG